MIIDIKEGMLMNELEIERNKINEIDEKMLDLFVKRMECSKKIGLYKEKHNLPIFDENRENEIISNKLSKFNNDELKEYYLSFIKDLMDISKKYQKDIIKDDK